MNEAIDELERISQDENIIGLYDAELLQEKFEKSIREEGFEDGLEQGIKDGINQSKIEIAKNLLNDNMDISMIAKYTGLTIEEINQLND